MFHFRWHNFEELAVCISYDFEELTLFISYDFEEMRFNSDSSRQLQIRKKCAIIDRTLLVRSRDGAQA